MSPASRIGIVVVALAVIGGAFWWGSRKAEPPPALPPPPVVKPVAPPHPPPVDAKPAIAHPIETPPSKPPLPGLDSSDDYLQKALDELLGKKSVLSFVIADSLARRFVATVNNLGTDNAPSSHWPVQRTPGRFETVADTGDGGAVIGAKNAERYTPLVRLVDGVDTQKLVALYARVYPLLQRAYEELGFPGQYFNDRVVEVIDNLLATPAVQGPIKVKQVTADGKPRPPTANGLWIFDDPSLESRTAGQKILLRVGPDNAHRLKAKLTEIRRRIAKGPGPG